MASKETLGNFKIEVAVEGKEKVEKDLNAIRAGMKDLQAGFKSAAKEGKALSAVMKEIRGSSGKGGGKEAGGSIKGVLSGAVSEWSKSLTKASGSVSLFADALKKATADMRSQAKALDRFGKMADSATGREVLDKDGNPTGRYTGLRGFMAGLSQTSTSGKSLRGALSRMAEGIKAVNGAMPKGKSKDKLTDSLKTLSKAAKDAAKSLAKLAKQKGGDGKDGGGGSGVGGAIQPTFVEKMLKSMKGGEKSFAAVGKMISHANMGNLGVLSKLASGLGGLGKLAGMLGSGPLGWGLAAIGVGSMVVSKNNELKSQGRSVSHELYGYSKALDASGLDANAIARSAERNRYAYIQWKKDGEGNPNGYVDGVATDKASREAAFSKAANMADSWSLFETRGVEAQWMTALANQGIDYTKVKDYDTLREVLAEQYQKAKLAGNDSDEMRQWRTLRSELGDFVKAEDYQAIVEGNGIKDFYAKSAAMGKKTLGDKTGLDNADYVFNKTMETAALAYDTEIEKQVEAMKTATGGLSQLGDRCHAVGESMGLLGRKIHTALWGDNHFNPPKAAYVDPALEARAKAILENSSDGGMYRGMYSDAASGSSGGLWGAVPKGFNPYARAPIAEVNRATERLDTASSAIQNRAPVGPLQVNVKVDSDAASDVGKKLASPMFQECLTDAVNAYLQGTKVR